MSNWIWIETLIKDFIFIKGSSIKMNKNSNKANKERFASMRLAEINATDKEDLINCASDMEKTASLDSNEAVVVAKAIRAKYLPNIARQAGLDVSNLDLNHGKETVDFANDESDDEEDDMEFHHFESDEDSEDVNDDDMSDEDMDDEDEVEDSDDVATFEIEVPADMVDQAQKAVQQALDNLLGGDDVSDEDDDEDITHFNEDEDDMDSEDESENDEDNETQFIKKSKEVRSMTKQALAERKAQREALLRRAEREEILKKIASEEETYPAASASFKYNEDMVDMTGEVEYPSMTMQSSEGNSLKEQNPTWAEQKVPTMNPGSLEFPSVTKPSKFEGSGDGSLEYTVDWEELENPSEGLEDVDHPQIPTQMPSMPHKTTKTVAASKDDHEVECTSCGSAMRMSEAAMEDPNTKCANKDCPTNKDASEDDEEDMDRKSVVNDVDKAQEMAGGAADAVRNVNQGAQKATQQLSEGLKTNASLDLARIKTSYSCATKLALAGIITSEEVDSYAEQMINDGLKSDSMIRQTKLLLKSAQSSTERVVAAAAERMSTRTASTLGVSTSPALSGGLSNNSAALDIQGALKGTWTMPKIED
jgi:hypothetical protein